MESNAGKGYVAPEKRYSQGHRASYEGKAGAGLTEKIRNRL